MKILISKWTQYRVGLLVLYFVYMEFVFRILTAEKVWGLEWIPIFLFSLVGGIGMLLCCTIVRHPVWNTVIKLLMLLICMLPYAVIFFVYCKFHVFYNLDTIFGGASDAMSGFSGDIYRLVISPKGLWHLALFLLPFLWYVIWGRRRDTHVVLSAKTRIGLLVAGILLFALARAYVAANTSARRIYGEEYSFPAAITNFGVMTAIRLDCFQTGQNGDAPISFETEPEVTSGKVEKTEGTEGTWGTEGLGQIGESQDTEHGETPPQAYGSNALDIDFEKLGEGAPEALASLDAYVASLEPSSKNAYTGIFRGKNLIFITAEAFSAEAIDPVLTPTLYRLATKGINFTDYYEPASAGTTGGEYSNLIGLLPTSGGKSMKEVANNHNYMTMGSQLNALGYYGKMYHNNSYTYYDRDKTHVTLGYSDGYMGYGNGMEEFVTKQWPQSDLEMIRGTLPSYIQKQPFNIYYMSVSGHGDYSFSTNAMSRKHEEQVKDLECSEPVKAYLACQIELEEALTYLVKALEAAGIADDTVICLAADHFPYGLDQSGNTTTLPYLSELYGCDITNNLIKDHNRLILWCGSLEKEAPVIVEEPTFSLDILPTLCNLFGVEYDSRLLPGRDVFSDAKPLVFNLGYDWKTDLGTYIASKNQFTPADDSVTVPEGYVENMKTVVRNKIKYCKGVLDQDYYAHVFGD